MADLTATTVTRAGVNPDGVAVAVAAGGDKFITTGAEFLYFKNTDVTARTVTLVTPRTVDGLAVTDRTVTVPAGEARLVGPLSPSTYGDSADSNKVSLTYDAATGLSVAVLKLAAAG